jgi:hypothetical protein
MLDLKYEFLCDINADLEDPIDVGATPHGMRMIFNITGGTVEGPNVSGEVLPTGADWLVIRSDMAAELDVRATMKTSDNEIIYTYYRGIIDASLEVFDSIQKGEDVDPSTYYFRTTPVFETASEKYGWLNKIVAVGVGKLAKNKVIYRVYKIL